MKLSLLPVTLLLLLATSCSPIKITANTVTLGADDKINLAGVNFAYDKWSKKDDAKFIEKMKGYEPKWKSLVTDNFNAKASSLGLDSGAGKSVPVEISIDELNPGSRAARAFVGFGAGKGRIAATAKVGDGSISASGVLSGGNYGGNFDAILKALGSALATALSESRSQK